MATNKNSKPRKKIADTSKMGRPRKHNFVPQELRDIWKEQAANYYRKNREEILARARRRWHKQKEQRKLQEEKAKKASRSTEE